MNVRRFFRSVIEEYNTKMNAQKEKMKVADWYHSIVELVWPISVYLPQNAHSKSFEKLNNLHAQSMEQLKSEHKKRQEESNKEMERQTNAHHEQMAAFFSNLANPNEQMAAFFSMEQVFIWEN